MDICRVGGGDVTERRGSKDLDCKVRVGTVEFPKGAQGRGRWEPAARMGLAIARADSR